MERREDQSNQHIWERSTSSPTVTGCGQSISSSVFHQQHQSGLEEDQIVQLCKRIGCKLAVPGRSFRDTLINMLCKFDQGCCDSQSVAETDFSTKLFVRAGTLTQVQFISAVQTILPSGGSQLVGSVRSKARWTSWGTRPGLEPSDEQAASDLFRHTNTHIT
jgi:hypothetical protein